MSDKINSKRYIAVGAAAVGLGLMGSIAIANKDTLYNMTHDAHKLSDHGKTMVMSQYPLFENHPDDSFSQFLNFVATFKQSGYESQDEFYHRYDVFQKNYDKIVKHNRIEDVPFTMDINAFADMTEEEFLSTRANGVFISEERRKRAE